MYAFGKLTSRIMQIILKILPTLNIKAKYVNRFFILFYFVGAIGLLVPVSFAFFLKLIPLALLISLAALAIFHGRFTKKQVILYTGIYCVGFLVEAAGVNTGLIFGSYYYGDSLGLKIFNTPVIIGLNWLLLVYLTASVLEPFKLPRPVKVVAGALMMLVYDLILEQVAPVLDMWYWENGKVPVKNYITWFILALLFHSLVKMFKLNTSNKLAPFIFLCQVVFFLALLLFL
jgi:bisanhydrobacterioruberin hydratase